MAGDRDWDKELARVDKQLASMSDDELRDIASKPVRAGEAKPAESPPPSKQNAVSGETPTTSWGVYARLALSVALGIAMVLWPYPDRCGFGLAGYLAAVIVVVASGMWSSVWTWRHRASRAHTLSLLIVLWGLILGSMEVLPRIGYAKADARHPSTWTCR
ncbi:MAG TPA: hypothetical protein VHV78_16035 [Gemmatimonadaceae bacterium]|jgi:hypothetical protein|nr:hypothetical protein [Gemmatimonadaceae bacterium]